MEGLTDDLTKKKLALSILRELKLSRLVDENYLKDFYGKNKESFDNLTPFLRAMLGSQILEDLDELEHDVFQILNRYKTTPDDDFIYSVAANLVCRYVEHRLSKIGLIKQASP